MSNDTPTPQNIIKVQSTRFGELDVPEETIIEFPGGLIGFPGSKRYIILEHKPPFSWLHSVDDPSLAFVVVDGFEFGQHFDVRPPSSDKECDFREDDEYAILIIVTVRSDPKLSTANLKAPLFVNMRNRKGLQIILDDNRYSVRHPLWAEEEEGSAGLAQPEKEDKK